MANGMTMGVCLKNDGGNKKMIKAKLEIGQEEVSALREIMMANPKNVKKRKYVRIFSVIMAIVMAICTVVCFLEDAFGYSLLGLVFIIFLAWVTLGGATFYQDFIYKKLQNKTDGKLKSGMREYSFDLDGVTVTSEVGYGLNKWEAFKCWGIFKEYVYLKRIDNQMILLKKNDLSKEDYEVLLSLLNTYLTEEKLSWRNAKTTSL